MSTVLCSWTWQLYCIETLHLLGHPTTPAMQRDTITWMLCISNFIQVRMWAMVSRLPQSNYNDMGKQFLLWRNVRQVKFIPHRWRTNIYWPTILSNCFKTHPQIFSLPKLNLHVCWWRQSGSEHPANVMQFTSRTQNWVSVVSIRGLLGGGGGVYLPWVVESNIWNEKNHLTVNRF